MKRDLPPAALAELVLAPPSTESPPITTVPVDGATVAKFRPGASLTLVTAALAVFADLVAALIVVVMTWSVGLVGLAGRAGCCDGVAGA